MPNSETIFRPSWKGWLTGKLLGTLGGGIGALLFSVLLLLFSPNRADPMMIFFGFCLGIIGLFHLSMLANFFVFRIQLSDRGLVTMEGILRKSQSVLLYSQIQNVETSQTFWEKILKLKHVQISTMSSQSLFSNLSQFAFSETDADQIIMLVYDQTKNPSEKKMVVERATKDDANPYPIHAFKVGFPFFAIWGGLWTALTLFLTPSVLMEPDFSRTWGIVLVAIIPAGILWLYNYLELNSVRYYFLKKDFHTQTGYFSRFTKTSPYENIRDILISQNFYVRLMGLGELSPETGQYDDYVSKSDTNHRSYALLLQRSIPALRISDAYSLRDDFFRILKLKTNFLSPSLIEKFPLLNVKPIKKWIVWAIGGVVLLLAFFVYSYFYAVPIQPWGNYFAVFIVILLVIKLVHEYAYWKVYDYNASSDILIIGKGVFNRKEIAIPFSKIENAYLDQDVLDRLFGLWDLHFETPTMRSNKEAHIDGLSEKDAQHLLDAFLKQMKDSQR